MNLSVVCLLSDDDLLPEELPDEESTNLTNVIELKLASVLLKFENAFLVPSAAVNKLLEELQYLIGSVSVPATQRTLKGTMQCVVADNLGAHSIAGFVESFSGRYVCRFCTADRFDFQIKDVGAGGLLQRTKEINTSHLS